MTIFSVYEDRTSVFSGPADVVVAALVSALPWSYPGKPVSGRDLLDIAERIEACQGYMVDVEEAQRGAS